MSSSLRLNFFGSAPFVLPLLESIHLHRGRVLSELAREQLAQIPLAEQEAHHITANLLESPYLQDPLELVCVVTQPDRENRGRVVRNKIAQYCLDNNIPLFQPRKMRAQVEEYLAQPRADLGIVAAYGQILPMPVVEAQRYGLLNWHPSLLPEYRGPTPIQSVLRDKRTHTGLSWIKVDEQMDAGDIYWQSEYRVQPRDTFLTLADYFATLGTNQWALVLALRILDRERAAGEYAPRRQKFSDVTFCSLLQKTDKFVDPSVLTATELDAHYRAYLAFPGTVYTSDYFQSEVKLIEVEGVVSASEFEKLHQEASSLGVFDEWVRISIGKQVKTLLKTKDGFLSVTKLGLSSGKQITLSGYQF